MAKPVTSVKGVGSVAAETLAKQGITSVEELASLSVEQLSLMPGFSAALSTRVIAEARNMLAPDKAASIEVNTGPSASSPKPESPAKGKSKGKGKGKSKGRGKEKEKGKNIKEKGSDKHGKTTAPEAVISKKAAILIKLLTRQIESRKARIAKHTRKLERLERALREALVKYHRD